MKKIFIIQDESTKYYYNSDGFFNSIEIENAWEFDTE